VPADEGDSALEWPDDTEESAFLAESAARGEVLAAPANRVALPVIGERLPSLEELLAKVPPSVTGLLDDLFRAKFTGVRRYSDGAGTPAP
jgi:hypothetical protein